MTIRICLLRAEGLTAGAAPPNFVFILADDQAWNGLSRRMIRSLPESGSDFHRTPNIDRLAREGMTFSRAYAAAPKCEPSRYAITFGMTTTSLDAPDKRTAARVRAETRHSLANSLKQANSSCRTATFGKWQLSGSHRELGFDRDDGRITENRDGESPDSRDPKRMFEVTQNGNAGADGPYHYHVTPDYPRVNGGFRGRIELREGQVAAQPRARGLWPFKRPIRDAAITGFNSLGEGAYRLRFDLRGQVHSVRYMPLPAGGAEFVFTDGRGLSRSETYAARPRRGGWRGAESGSGNRNNCLERDQ